MINIIKGLLLFCIPIFSSYAADMAFLSQEFITALENPASSIEHLQELLGDSDINATNTDNKTILIIMSERAAHDAQALLNARIRWNDNNYNNVVLEWLPTEEMLRTTVLQTEEVLAAHMPMYQRIITHLLALGAHPSLPSETYNPLTIMQHHASLNGLTELLKAVPESVMVKSALKR